MRRHGASVSLGSLLDAILFYSIADKTGSSRQVRISKWAESCAWNWGI